LAERAAGLLALALLLFPALAPPFVGSAASAQQQAGGIPPQGEEWELLSEALALLERLQALSKKSVNVSDLASQLNEALALSREGRREEASRLLREVERRVQSLEATADRHYREAMAAKYARVGAALSAPVLFYALFPRLYVALWFRSRRRWVVHEPARR